MSRPRKPFGAQQPGRLQSTMMKVLAAEMSDPQRLKRGKQYWKNGSVTDIIIEPGAVTCEIQGSRSLPYIASLEVRSGDGMPLRRDVSAKCTCPDDANSGSHACKHVLATMFTFADELLMEPELLDVWRNNEHADADPGEDLDDIEEDDDHDHDDVDEAPTSRRVRSVQSFDPDADDPAEANSLRRSKRRRFEAIDGDGDGSGRSIHDDVDPDDDDPDDDGTASIARRRRHLRLVREGMEQGRAERRENQARKREPMVDPIADVLAHPEGTSLPTIPSLERAVEVTAKRPDLAAILRDAYRNLRIDWD